MAEVAVEDGGATGAVASVLPDGTVTFLLTDVEASSALWEADPQSASAWLRRHEEIARDCVAGHGGVQPVEQGEGDSSVSVFARVSDAAQCAVDIQRRLGADSADEEIAPRVRVALHTGEAELRDDGTYRGAALNRCARLRAAAHGGQIVLSQATHEVLVDQLSLGLSMHDLGVHRLRDLTRPEHVWELRSAGSVGEFPPLRSLDAARHNLPVQVTSFVGREADMAAVHALLEESRLVTLTGSGGCGKTRLGLQLAAEALDEYPDGAWWVDLAAVDDPSLAPAVLAEVLGVRESPVEPIADTVVRHLGPRRALVILDNCEHLIDACAALASRLLQGCSSLSLLATSREPLGVDGETTWRVPSLSLPVSTGDVAPTAETSEAMRLFLDRAQAARPDFSLSDEQAAAVAEICIRLDGIPLAIELAAARLRVLAVEQIAEGLADRFHLLTGGARTALPRQRTLEASVDWSHDLLDLDEQVLFRRLSVFSGNFSLEAAQAVCARDGIAADGVLDLMSSLVDRSLVQVEDAGTRTRYRLLETIRDYALHKLTDSGEIESVRDRHLRFYVGFAEDAGVGLEGPEMVAWLERVDVEIGNVRAALAWSRRSSDAGLGLRIVGSLAQYWWTRSELTVGRARLEAPLGRAASDPRDRAEALIALSLVAYRAGETAAARDYGEEAATIGREIGDARLLGRALTLRGGVVYGSDEPRADAWRLLEEAVVRAREAGDDMTRALALTWLGSAYTDTTASGKARACLEDGLALTSATGALRPRIDGLYFLGALDLREGRFESAVEHAEEALALTQQLRDPWFETVVRVLLMNISIERGEYEAAREEYERAAAMANEHRNPFEEVIVRFFGAELKMRLGELDAADEDFDAAHVAFRSMMPRFAVFCRARQAQVALARSDVGRARPLVEEALARARAIDSTVAVGWALTAKARLARLDRVPDHAEDLLHEAIDVTLGATYLAGLCPILDALAGAVADQGRFEESARILGAAQGLADAIGYARPPVEEPDYVATVSAVRDALGDDAFNDAHAEGAALSLDDAVAYVRRGRGKRRRPAHGWNSLTPTEQRVVELVTEGLTNPQIGERMFISKRTVQTHVSHVFAKLGISTRAELAAAFARRQADAS